METSLGHYGKKKRQTASGLIFCGIRILQVNPDFVYAENPLIPNESNEDETVMSHMNCNSQGKGGSSCRTTARLIEDSIGDQYNLKRFR